MHGAQVSDEPALDVTFRALQRGCEERDVCPASSTACQHGACAHIGPLVSTTVPETAAQSSQSTFSGLSQPDALMSQASSQSTAVEMEPKMPEGAPQQANVVGNFVRPPVGSRFALASASGGGGSRDQSPNGGRTLSFLASLAHNQGFVASAPPLAFQPAFQNRAVESMEVSQTHMWHISGSQSSEAATSSNHPLSQRSAMSTSFEPDSQDSMHSLAVATEHLMLQRYATFSAPSRSRSPLPTAPIVRNSPAPQGSQALGALASCGDCSSDSQPRLQRQQHARGLRTGKRRGAKCCPAPSRQCYVRSPNALPVAPATPQNQEMCEPTTPRPATPPACVTPRTPAAATPAVRCQRMSPPSPPNLRRERQEFEDDIRTAIEWCSVPFLSMTLLRDHECTGNHAIHEAIRLGHLPALEFLLSQEPESIEETCMGRSPLLWAVHCEGSDEVRILLQAGAQPDAVSGDGKDAPLYQAAKRGNTRIVRLLLERGADANLTLADGSTALHAACGAVQLFCGQAEAVRDLLEAGCDPRIRDSLNRRAADVFEEALNPMGLTLWFDHCMDPQQAARDNAIREMLNRKERWMERKNLMFARGRTPQEGTPRTDDAGTSITSLPEAVFRSVVGYL